MANQIRQTQRTRQKLEFNVNDFTGGFVSQHSSYNVQEQYLEDVKNMEIIQSMWQKRKGYTLSGMYTAIDNREGTVRGAHVFNKQDSFNLLVVSNENLYVTKSLTGNTHNKLFNGEIPNSGQISFTDFRDDCYIAYGKGRIKKFNGTKVTDVPSPQGDILTSYDNRLLVAGIKGSPLTVYFSDRGSGEAWEALSYFTLDGTSSERITALYPSIGKLYIFTNQNIYSLAGPLESYAISMEVSGLGAVKTNAVGMDGNKFYFVGGDYKIYEYDGGNFPTQISVNISQYVSYNFTKDSLRNMRITSLGSSIWFTLDNSKKKSERVTLVYFPDYQAWSRYIGIPSAEFIKVDDTLYFVPSDRIGPIYRYGTHFSDEIDAIDAYLKTTKWSFDFLENIKRFKKLYIRGAIQGGGGNGFTIDFHIDDSQVASVRVTSDIASETELWGDNDFGSMYWGDAMRTANTAWGQFDWDDSDWGGSELVFSPRWGTSTYNSFEWGDRKEGDLGDDVGKIDSKIFLSQYNVISGKYLQLVFRDKTPNHGFRVENMLLEYIQKGAR